MCSRILIAWI